MTASCVCASCFVISRAARVETIGQECEIDVALASDGAPHPRNDIDLVLLDDVEIGLEDMQETGGFRAETD